MRFVLLLQNDPAAASSQLSAGSAGLGFLERTIEQFGGTVDELVPVAGRYSTVVVCTLPSTEALLAFTASATANGQSLEALPAGQRRDMDAARDLARQVAAAQRHDVPPDDVPTAPEAG